MHDTGLIMTIAFGLTAALIFGLLAKRLGLSPIVGYLVAGIAVGPHTPGFVADANLAKQLAEIGVILLMFGVGLHFHLKDLLAVRSIAIPGAIGQSVVATLCALAVTLAIGWTWNAGLVLGIAISVASTVVLLRLLEDANMVETPEGRVAVGWLVVEDILTVLVLVLLPALAMENPDALGLVKNGALAIGKLALLGAIVGLVGARFVPWLLLRVVRLRSRELFTLTVLVIAMAVAALGYIAFGASMALGAFLAGMVVAQSEVSSQAAADALPMRDAFAVLFFVSVGMLFDWTVIWREPWLVVGLTAVIMIAKPAIALLIVLIRGHTLRTGLTVAAGLAQIGEFSFIVADSAQLLKILPDAGHDALVMGAIISISCNPWLFRRLIALEPTLLKLPVVGPWMNRSTSARGARANLEEGARPVEERKLRALVIGYGPVGRAVLRRVREFGVEPVVIDMNVDSVLALQNEKTHALFGDARRAEILKEAGVEKAAYLIVTLPDATTGLTIVTAARGLNPKIEVLVRARYLGEGAMLNQAGAAAVVYDEAEAATALTVVLRAHMKGAGLTRS